MALKYRFRPSFISLIVMAITVVILLKLGFWQLDRAQQKRKIIDKASNVAIYELNELEPKTILSLNNKTVKADVKIVTDKVWLLDNQVHKGKVGYGVIAAAFISDDVTGLVHLGWIPAVSNRGILPSFELPTQVQVTGILKTDDFEAFSLAEENVKGLNNRVQNLQQLFYQANPIISHKILLYANSNTVNQWPQTYKLVVMKPEKHEAYAVQWFLLALASVVVFAIASLKKESHIESK